MSDVSFKWATVMAVNPIAIRLDGDSLALALIPDSLIDPMSLSVGDRVRVEMSLRKVVIHGASEGSGTPAGKVDWFATPTAPAGWMLCQGQSLSRVNYPRLFAAIGVAYGAADSSSFNIPDMRSRFPVMRQAEDPTFATLNKKGGDKTHRAAIGTVNGNIGSIGFLASDLANANQRTTAYSLNVGNNISGDLAFNHHTPVMSKSDTDGTALPPYIVLNCAIKL